MPTNHRTRGFTLIETLIVVTILATIAAIVTPQFTHAREDTLRTNLRAQLQMVRKQIALHNLTRPHDQIDEDTPLDDFWSRLVDNELLFSEPLNLMQNAVTVAAEPAAGVGWVWGPNEAGDPASWDIYAVDLDGGYFDETP